MTRLLVGTDGHSTSERLSEYITTVVEADDQVYVLNSLPGGDETSTAAVEEGEAALDAMVEGLGPDVSVERHQFVRGNEPVEDLLAVAEEWDADEYVIGIRKRSPVGKVVFGSTAQNLLLEAERPVRCIPLVSD